MGILEKNIILDEASMDPIYFRITPLSVYITNNVTLVCLLQVNFDNKSKNKSEN